MNRYSRLYTTVSAIMYFSPVSRTSPTISLASSRLVAIGTVHMTCLPAFRAAIVCGAWSGIGLLMWTKSTFGSASTSLKFGVACGDSEPIADFIQSTLRPLTDCRDFGFRVRLIDWNELRPETKSDESNSCFFHDSFPKSSATALWADSWKSTTSVQVELLRSFPQGCGGRLETPPAPLFSHPSPPSHTLTKSVSNSA